MTKNPYQMEDKLFSICTPIYGVTYKHLERFAKHLSQSDYTHFEWVVVFDGSHKKGVKVMEKIKKEYPTMDISYYEIPHQGACAARNFGATKLKGEYWAFPGGDCYLYPQTLRTWVNAFDEDPEIYRVWGTYDLVKEDGSIMGIGLSVPNRDGEIYYPAFKYQNYCDGTFPVRKDKFVPYDVNCKSLQDWDWAIEMLKKDNFSGKGWKFINDSFFAAELPKKGGLSDDSHSNWIERTDYIRNKHGIPKSDICVTSLGAPYHGWKVAEMIGADYLPMPSFKPHKYKAIYLVGFYTKEDQQAQSAGVYVTKAHMQVFDNFKGKKIIHWIGTDILQLYKNASFEKLELIRKWFKENKVIHLAEADFTQKELKKFGIKAKVVPIPSSKTYEATPLPKEFSLAVYMPFNQNPDGKLMPSDIYLPGITDTIVRSMPDVKFYFYGEDKVKNKRGNWEYIGYIDLNEWMPKFSCNLRLTAHDGLPISCLEFMSAGRQVVTTVPLKGAIHTDLDRKNIVEAVRKAQKAGFNHKGMEYARKLTPERFKQQIWRLI